MSSADLDKRPDEVSQMFDGVADRYDRANGILTLGIDGSWRNAVTHAVDPKPGQNILDLAAGTGKSSIPLAEAGANVTAVDFSAGMIEVGRQRYPQLNFVKADITKLPFADATFDTVTISFGLRNVNDVRQGLSEMYRVLRPGGKLVICEFSKVEGKVTGPAYRFYLNKVLPKAAGLISHNKDAYKYLAESIEAWPKPQELLQLIGECGFVAPSYRSLTMGIVALHRGFKPQIPSRVRPVTPAAETSSDEPVSAEPGSAEPGTTESVSAEPKDSAALETLAEPENTVEPETAAESTAATETAEATEPTDLAESETVSDSENSTESQAPEPKSGDQ